MEPEAINTRDRVRENTSSRTNMKLDQKEINRIFKYRNLSPNDLSDRLKKLTREWDIGKALEVNASSIAIGGLLLGVFVSKRWLALPLVVTAFMLQYGVQGWCPPVKLLRSLGLRTRQEIEEEIYALKTLQGDFDDLSASSGPVEILSRFRK